jgi:gamma-glutamylcyclotransferase (GGCT)/AIG2-like uncharacterized protein YtfP
MNKLYFAYGSNLNHEHMKIRCPNARFVGTLTLPNWELVFRGVADISQQQGKEVKGGVFSITDKCESSLDIYEGYPYLYSKGYITIEHNKKKQEVMTYFMNDRNYLSSPSLSYLQTIKQGYEDCGLPLAQLETAVTLSKDNFFQSEYDDDYVE